MSVEQADCIRTSEEKPRSKMGNLVSSFWPSNTFFQGLEDLPPFLSYPRSGVQIPGPPLSEIIQPKFNLATYVFKKNETSALVNTHAHDCIVISRYLVRTKLRVSTKYLLSTTVLDGVFAGVY